MRTAVCVLALCLFSVAGWVSARSAEHTSDYAVQVSTMVQTSPPEIVLNWPQGSSCTNDSYVVYRKSPGANAWGRAIAYPGAQCSWTDTNVTAGVSYEYQVVRITPQFNGYGYVLAGIELPAAESRGKLLLVVDRTYAAQLALELATLEQDLTGDGWTVIRLDVNRTDSPAKIKKLIKSRYRSDPANVKCVFLFGHVPVPYSGNIVPDGHAPEHQGAWPCDGYYGDMDGVWTDHTVNITRSSDPRNRNIPGDGKFDQSSFPGPVKLMVGRVDLANMPGRLSLGGPPTFPSELELLRNYLTKDHRYRFKEFDLPRRGVVGDYFGVRDGEAFAASGWRNFAAFFGATNIAVVQSEGTWLSQLSSNAYLWAYGCGPGTYTSVGGLGTTQPFNDGVTTELVRNDVRAVFSILFGSWFGDWDAEDDMLRAVLATSTYGLTCAWSGRPHWFLHHMALGEPIGYSARLTQNNGPDGLYRNHSNNGAGQIQIALMGDPTLRMHVVAPPFNLAANTNTAGVNLTWNASTDSVLGYHVYRAPTPEGPYSRLNHEPVAGTSFSDLAGQEPVYYMVRALNHETSASGTYFNLSQGAFAGPVSSDRAVASAAGSKRLGRPNGG